MAGELWSMHFSGLPLKGQRITCSCFLPHGLMLYIVSAAAVRNLIMLVWIKDFLQTVWAEGALEGHGNVTGQSQKWGMHSRQDCSSDVWAAEGTGSPSTDSASQVELPSLHFPQVYGGLEFFQGNSCSLYPYQYFLKLVVILIPPQATVQCQSI